MQHCYVSAMFNRFIGKSLTTVEMMKSSFRTCIANLYKMVSNMSEIFFLRYGHAYFCHREITGDSRRYTPEAHSHTCTRRIIVVVVYHVQTFINRFRYGHTSCVRPFFMDASWAHAEGHTRNRLLNEHSITYSIATEGQRMLSERAYDHQISEVLCISIDWVNNSNADAIQTKHEITRIQRGEQERCKKTLINYTTICICFLCACKGRSSIGESETHSSMCSQTGRNRSFAVRVAYQNTNKTRAC